MSERLSPGTTISHYRIVSRIGAGGMGEVYLAEDTQLPRRAALKILAPEHHIDPERLHRFEHEAHAASALSHPNILVVYEIGSEGSLHYIATEFVEGETLRRRLARGPMTILEILDLAIQVSGALIAAHSAGIVHRDVKPENLMIRPDGFVKVLDFGLAKLADKKPEGDRTATLAHFETNPGTVMGSISYMSPEQARGVPLDGRSDIFSLGVVIYEMLTGRAPFTGATPTDVLIAVVERDPQPLDRFTKETPPELGRIVSKAMAKDREKRYQSAKDLSIDLRNLKAEIEAHHVLRRSGQGPGEAAVRLRRYLPAVLVAALLVAAAGLRYFLVQERGAREGARSGGVAATEVVRSRQVTTWSGLDLYPSLSPDGNSSAYTSDKSGNFEVYVKQLTPGGGEIQLTSDGGQNFQPAWSPDGQYIAFHSKNRNGIWIIPAFGGAARQATEFGSSPKWSPDGERIAFQSTGIVDLGVNGFPAMPPSTLWTVPSHGGSPTRVTDPNTPPGGHGAPAWSPDGQRLVFVSSDINYSALWTVAAAGGDLKQLTPRQRCFEPAWSRDGKVYYGGSGRGSWGVWSVPVSRSSGEAEGAPVELKDTGSTLYRQLALSADGKKLASSAMSMINNLWSVPVSTGSGETAGPPRPLTRDTSYRKSNPFFSPSGSKIAFGVTRIGSPQDIWVMDADGGNPTQVMSGETDIFVLGWLSNEDVLAVPPRQRQLLGFNIRTGRQTKLRTIDFDIASPRLSPDGKRVVFNSRESGAVNLWVASLEGGAPKQLTFDHELMGFACWSPDGRYLAFEVKRGEDTHVAVIRSDGGSPTLLTSEPGQSWTYSWSPDGDKIAFAAMRGGAWNIAWVSMKTREQRQLTHDAKLNTYVRYPAWSPHGNQIVYEYAETIGNIWLMELR